MRERPLVYLVPPMAAALYAAVCLELPVQLHIIAPIALLLVLAAVFLRRRKCLLNVFAVLAVLLAGNRTAIAGRRQDTRHGHTLCAGHARRL